ncbi:MAG TPA: response regulator transcription factor [Candidatus Obscuribacterales bacterium]
MAKILIVEDEIDLSEPVRAYLEGEHHLVEVVGDGNEAMERLRFYKYDVIILDWMLPGTSGLEVCKSFRASGGTTPVLMLTSRKQWQDKVAGLDSGADDYLTKPFEVQEISARIRALLRRPQSLNANVLTARNVVLEPGSFKVTRDEQDVALLPKEFALLEFFMRHPGQVFSAEALLDRVWSSESEASPETIRTYIKRLRQKIDTEGQPSLISTVHGVGYKLEA